MHVYVQVEVEIILWGVATIISGSVELWKKRDPLLTGTPGLLAWPLLSSLRYYTYSDSSDHASKTGCLAFRLIYVFTRACK